MSNTNKSILIGNGLDIQIGGDDYLNRWIIARLIIKAKLKKYDCLFYDNINDTNTITGDEIASIFNGLLNIAKKAIEGMYDNIVTSSADNTLLNSLFDFKKNYKQIPTSIDQIGIEDWIFLLKLYLSGEPDLLDYYLAAKKGFEWMILDSIYCEGNIQSLYKILHANKKATKFFNSFDSIFTLNYDHSVEKATKHTVMHLHGSFDEKLPIKRAIRHCGCSAILDFSGELKYNTAHAMSLSNSFVESVKEKSKTDSQFLDSVFDNLPENVREIIKVCVDKDINFPQDYHFSELENLSGELTIIGISPNNDNHIFSCINRSNISKVTFFNFFGTANQNEIEEIKEKITLPIDKPYKIENIKTLWDELDLNMQRSHNLYTLSDKQFDLINNLPSSRKISKQQLEYELNSIPPVTKGLLFKLIESEINKEKYKVTPSGEKELFNQFFSFGNVLGIASISPQTIYALYFLKHNRKK